MTVSVADVLAAHEAGDTIALATSGTSGAPRSVVRTTASWWSSFDAYSELSGVVAGSRLWLPGPLAATANLFAAVHAEVVGASVVPSASGADRACLTPALLDRHLSLLAPGTRVTVAGDRLTLALADRAEATGLVVAHYYGAAELSFVAAGREEASLHAFPGVDVEDRDGELWARSPYLALGYAGNGSGPLRRDGAWATVGDRGYVVDGRVLVQGRPETVTTAGVTVLLAEVERALSGATGRPVACFGVPRASVGEELAAAVTSEDDLARVRSAAREVLAPGHRPRRWLVVDAMPLTPAGKVDRDALRSLVRPDGSDTMPA
ncbi:MAG: hypothetical protein JWO46_2084 [Nocardioidaceae bacterium]|nr:hypothetical protein [Nocardioidaceae bacterium]